MVCAGLELKLGGSWGCQDGAAKVWGVCGCTVCVRGSIINSSWTQTQAQHRGHTNCRGHTNWCLQRGGEGPARSTCTIPLMQSVVIKWPWARTVAGQKQNVECTSWQRVWIHPPKASGPQRAVIGPAPDTEQYTSSCSSSSCCCGHTEPLLRGTIAMGATTLA